MAQYLDLGRLLRSNRFFSLSLRPLVLLKHQGPKKLGLTGWVDHRFTSLKSLYGKSRDTFPCAGHPDNFSSTPSPCWYRADYSLEKQKWRGPIMQHPHSRQHEWSMRIIEGRLSKKYTQRGPQCPSSIFLPEIFQACIFPNHRRDRYILPRQKSPEQRSSSSAY